MATISQLAAVVAERCGRSESAAVFIRRGREFGYLPYSGSGGRGNLGAPAATTEDAVILMLAMLQREREPRAAMRAVDALNEFEPFSVYEWVRDAAGGLTLAASGGRAVAQAAVGCTFGASLQQVINLHRAWLVN